MFEPVEQFAQSTAEKAANTAAAQNPTEVTQEAIQRSLPAAGGWLLRITRRTLQQFRKFVPVLIAKASNPNNAVMDGIPRDIVVSRTLRCLATFDTSGGSNEHRTKGLIARDGRPEQSRKLSYELGFNEPFCLA